MSAKLHSPDRWWFFAALATTVVVAVLSAGLFYSRQVSKRGIERALSEGARQELASLVVPARKTAELERSWVEEGFAGEYLIAPVGPMPCAAVTETIPPRDRPMVRDAFAASAETDPDVRLEQLAIVSDSAPGNLLVAQMLGTRLVEMGRYPEAERVLARALDGTTEDEQIIRAARESSRLDLDDVAVSTVIHVHHALGVTRLSQSSAEPPWLSLKNVIGSVKPLSRRRLLGTTRGQPAWSRLLIAAPGCPSAGGAASSLSSYDLFNNLIAGYMRGTFAGTDREREREFARPRKDNPGPLHKLLVAQVERARNGGWENEAQLWALSNVEQIIEWQLPEDARMAVNSVQVIDWWTNAKRCPAEVCTPILLAGIHGVRDQLIEQAFRRRNVSEQQKGAFARGVVGMLASSTLDRRRVADAAATIREWLPVSERRTLEDLIAADAARAALPQWLFAPRTDEERAGESEPHAKLGPRAQRWYAAALTDVVAVVARWAAQRPPREQRATLIAMRQLLGSSEAPPELVQLENQRSLLERLRLRLVASKAFWAIIAVVIGTVLWFALLWILVHIRERHLLRVSLYNVEHEYLAGIDREPGP